MSKITKPSEELSIDPKKVKGMSGHTASAGEVIFTQPAKSDFRLQSILKEYMVWSPQIEVKIEKLIAQREQAARREVIEKILQVTPSSQVAAVQRFIDRAYPSGEFVL